MKRLSVLLSFISLALFSSLSLRAQAPALTWQKAVGGSGDDAARAVAPMPDGGYIAAGYTNSTDGDIAGLTEHGGYDYLVVKFNADGTVAWKKTYGGSKDDKAYAVIPTNDNGYIVAGTSGSNDGDVNGDNHINSNNHQPSNDFWVVKIDGSGNIQWAKSYGGGNDDEATAILQTADGGYIVGGYTNSTDGDISGNHGNYDYVVVRIDGSGNKRWTHAYGGKGLDQAYAMARTPDGGYVLTGKSLSGSGGDVTGTNHGSGDCWTIKIDSGGTLLWNFLTGGSGTDQGNGIYGTADNGCIVAASTGSSDFDLSGLSHGATDGWVIKLDANGGKTWSKTYGGGEDDYAEAIRLANDGNYIIAGQTASTNLPGVTLFGGVDFWLFEIDLSGNMQWQNVYGGTGTDIAYSVYPTSDTGYIIAGITGSDDKEVTGDHLNNGAPTNDMWVIKVGGHNTQSGVKEGNLQNSIPASPLLNIYPNPSSLLARIDYAFPQPANVSMGIYDMLGNKLQTLASGVQTAGGHSVAVDLSGYCDGMYICRVESAAGSAMKLLGVVKR